MNPHPAWLSHQSGEIIHTVDGTQQLTERMEEFAKEYKTVLKPRMSMALQTQKSLPAAMVLGNLAVEE